MDPLTAVSLAACVVQFTDFGIRLLSESYEVYKSTSGQASDIIALSTVASDLSLLSGEVEQQSCNLSTSSSSGAGGSELTLVRLCGECKVVSQELQKALAHLRAEGTGSFNFAIKSFVVVVQGFWSSHKINGLRGKLVEIRQQMMMAAIVCLWQERKQEADSIRHLSKHQADMMESLTRIDDTTRQLSEGIQGIILRPSLAGAALRRVQEIYSLAPISPQVDKTRQHAAAEVPPQSGQLHDDVVLTNAIIASLPFQEMTHREDAIPQAYRQTFEWVFKHREAGESAKASWRNFPAWLEGKVDEIYWITGKPGCGKSTLMKFILKDKRLLRHLRVWSGARQMALASFYFWTAGTDMQTSHEGLLRTLLHQILQQLPHFVPNACARRWNLYKIFGPDALQLFPQWSWPELVEAFSILASESGKDFCIALFIDGLDEFHGAHETLVNLTHALHKRGEGGIKICLSSRPWNVFIDAYKRNPSLQVQDLTKGDIELFVREKLQQHQGFRELKEVFPVEAREIMDEVVKKAQGVFLWVSIVVCLLIASLTEGDKLSSLKELVDSLPDDLSQLYQGIWNNINPQYLPNASQFFQIHKASLTTLQATTLWLADEEFALDIDVNAMLRTKKSYIIDSISRRLNSRTKGILEVTPQGTIEYLHRTAHDWVRGIWKNIVAQSPPNFDPNLVLLKASVAQYTGKMSNYKKDFWLEIIGFMNYAAKVEDSSANASILIQSLDMLDAVATTSAAQLGSSSHHWSSTQTKSSLDNNFVGLTAQFAVLPYIREKVEAQPQLLLIKPGAISLLESAIFGCKYFMDDGDLQLSARTHTSTITSRRIELVRFLLEKNSNIPRLDNNGTQLIKVVRKRPFVASPCVDREGEAVDYWDAVAGLLAQTSKGMKRPDTSKNWSLSRLFKS